MLNLLFSSRPKTGPFDDVDDSKYFFAGGFGGLRTRAGVPVTEEVALTLAAWWCGCRILCEAVGGLPMFTYERQGEDRKLAADLPLFDLLWRAPNPDMPSGPFREGRVLHAINSGNGFSEIEWDSYIPARRTKPIALWPIHAQRVRPVDSRMHPNDYADGYRYRIRNNDNTEVLLKPDEMLHIPGIFPEDGI